MVFKRWQYEFNGNGVLEGWNDALYSGGDAGDDEDGESDLEEHDDSECR